MPSEDIGPSNQENKGRSGSGGNSGLITVIVTLVTVLGGIVVAVINKSPTTPPYKSPETTAGSGPAVAHTPDPDTSKQAADPPPGPDQTPSGVMNPLQIHVGLMGGTDYANHYVDNADVCYEMCRVDRRCRAMTFIYSNKLCYLKTAVTDSSPNSDMASATKLSP
jgi:hypothetical protein